MRALHVALLVLVRFLRRGRQLFALSGMSCAYFLVVGFSLLSGPPGAALEMFRNLFLVLEAPLLVAMALALAGNSVRADQEAGAKVLLDLSGLSPSDLALGRLLGVSAICLVIHALWTIPLLAATPLIREPHGLVAFRFGAVLLVAIAAIPDGLLTGSFDRPLRRRTIGLGLVLTLRLLAPILILWLLWHVQAEPDARMETSRGTPSVLMAWAIGFTGGPAPAMPSPALPLAVVLAWNAVTAPLVFVAGLRRARA